MQERVDQLRAQLGALQRERGMKANVAGEAERRGATTMAAHVPAATSAPSITGEERQDRCAGR